MHVPIMSVAKAIGHRAVHQWPRVLQHVMAQECTGAAACSSDGASMQSGGWRSAADLMSSRSFSSDAQPAEEPRVASGLNMVKGGTVRSSSL